MAYRRLGYQYETSPRKLKPEIEPITQDPKGKRKSSTRNIKKQKEEAQNKSKIRAKVVLSIFVGFSILFAISYRNSLITENFNKKENLKKQLSVLQKENAQIEISIQNSLNLANVEKSASSLLGMKKLDETQKVYITLPKKDYVEPASEQVVVTEEKGWFEKLLDTISSFF